MHQTKFGFDELAKFIKQKQLDTRIIFMGGLAYSNDGDIYYISAIQLAKIYGYCGVDIIRNLKHLQKLTGANVSLVDSDARQREYEFTGIRHSHELVIILKPESDGKYDLRKCVMDAYDKYLLDSFKRTKAYAKWKGFKYFQDDSKKLIS